MMYDITTVQDKSCVGHSVCSNDQGPTSVLPFAMHSSDDTADITPNGVSSMTLLT
jgi:hypothetical protein